MSPDPERLAPGLRRVVAANPSPLTGPGTNTYILGHEVLCIIDPGPALPAHLDALFAAIGTGRVSHIVVTHAHRDHSALAAELSVKTGAPVLAFGDCHAGRSAAMQMLAAQGLSGGGEGLDTGFRPNRTLADGNRLEGPDWALTALHMPGHAAGHLCLKWGDAVFCGDLVLGWASTLVSPPDGDMGAFMASCARLRQMAPARLYAGHGAPVTDPAARLDWLIAHRQDREAQILDVLRDGRMDAATVARRIYTDLDPALLPAATRNVFAHLVDLEGRLVVSAHPRLQECATFALCGSA